MYKKFVIRHYENSKVKSKRNTAKVFGIGRSTIIEWIQDKEKIMEQKSLLRRNHSKTDKQKRALYTDTEVKVFEWFASQRANSIVMTVPGLQNKMNELMKTMHPDDSIIFKCSRGWVQNFMKRYDLTIRRITTSGRELPKNCAELINGFLNEVKEKIIENGKRII